ncbi:nucleoside diphosphate kinase 2, chloroplastic isoform X2 [Amborella trichopoda]|uniref:nucleoside diphosphate kinase 2, chloroplastic isoform X2 n=1 Tax=Amborella trichopoda TaxID=13333 RepID=UPI0009BEB3EB|nr:nucleoside diphosphate kinase 2, chloroplastic isoform X2 [Amborella trichopoda]|eukprot:XP_020527725.1 nucleoside diphosphate kinase 2, chloroplastic isoform X2 [Amborella trichopoda]
METLNLTCYSSPTCFSLLKNQARRHSLAPVFSSSLYPSLVLSCSLSRKGNFLEPARKHASRSGSRGRSANVFLPHLVASMVGEIISRFEKKGFLLKGLKLFQCPEELAKEHYRDLQSKSFFPKLIQYVTSGPVVCMAWEGVGVVASARKLIGATNPLEAQPGTIRGDLAIQTGRNVIHGSDSPENGQREIALWFKEDEIYQWTQADAPWLME